MEFEEMIRLSLEIERRFDEINERRWEVQTITVELSKQVGDLCKVILKHEGTIYQIEKKEKIIRLEKMTFPMSLPIYYIRLLESQIIMI